MDSAIRRILDRVAGWEGKEAAVEPLSGGITNRNFKATIGGEAYVVRIGGEGTELLGIDRRNEHAAGAAAASLGIGAEVIAFIPEENALVTRFIAGKTLTPEDAARPDLLRRIAESIRRVHSGPAIPGTFSPFDVVRGYHRLALERGVEFPANAARALERLKRIEAALGPPAEPRPCHNDLLAANFIDDGKAVRILDWEYAGMGDPFFDLGNFAVNQRLKKKQCESFLRHYAGKARRRDLARLHLMRLASDMRESFWGFLQSGISKLDFDFLDYGRTHLDRFLRTAAPPDFPRWLEKAKK